MGAIAGAAAFFQGLTLAHRLLDPDEAGYSAIAALMNAGGRLYADGGVDNKPPVIFWVYSLIFRAFGRYDLTAVHALKIAVVLATAGFVALIARRLAGEAAAAGAALLYIAFTAAGYGNLAAANTEVFMMLPATASFWLLLERRWLLSGAVLAVAVLTKQVAAVQVLLYPAAAILLHLRARAVVEAAAGFGIGLAVLLGIVAVTGSLAGFWQWAVLALVTGYGPSAWTGGQVLRDAGNGLVPWLLATPLLTVPALLRLALVRAAGTEERLTQAWLVVSAAGAVAGGHFFGHYFIELVGPLAALSAVAVTGLAMRGRARVAAAAVVAALAVPAVVTVLQDYSGTGVQSDPASVYVAAHSGPADRVFVWGNSPQVYVYSGLVPGTRFPGFLRGFPRSEGLAPRSWDTTAEVWPQLAADFDSHPPLYVVDTSTAGWSAFGLYPMSRFPVLPEIVAARYELVAEVDRVAIYRLR